MSPICGGGDLHILLLFFKFAIDVDMLTKFVVDLLTKFDVDMLTKFIVDMWITLFGANDGIVTKDWFLFMRMLNISFCCVLHRFYISYLQLNAIIAL